MKPKKFDPFSHSMDTMRLSAGVSLGGMLVEDINAETGSHVDTGPAMNMLGTLPTIHAAKGVFMSLEDMGNMTRRKKR